MVIVPMSREQFEAKVAELAEKQGLHLVGDSGSVSKDGVTIAYDYDGHSVTARVVSKPFMIPASTCEAKLRAWLRT